MKLSQLRDKEEIREAALVILQMTILVGIVFTLTLLHATLVHENFSWTRFILNMFFSIYAKMVFTSLSIKRYKRDPQILTLIDTIDNDRKEIFNKKLNSEFQEKLNKMNKLRKIKSYIYLLDSKIPKKTEKLTVYNDKRKYATELLLALENEDKKKEEELREYIDLSNLKVKYNKISYSTIFSYGSSVKVEDESLEYNETKAALDGAFIPMIGTFIVSYIFSTLIVDEYWVTGQAIFDFFSYMFIICMGSVWGYNNGKSTILNGYQKLLNSIVRVIRTIKNEILEDKN